MLKPFCNQCSVPIDGAFSSRVIGYLQEQRIKKEQPPTIWILQFSQWDDFRAGNPNALHFCTPSCAADHLIGWLLPKVEAADAIPKA